VKKREGSVRVYRIADNEEEKKNTVRVHQCNEEDAVSVYRQQEKEGSVRVYRITKEEAR